MKTRIPGGQRARAQIPAAHVDARQTRQRVEAAPKTKPPDATLRQILAPGVSGAKGSCQACAEQVYGLLASHVDQGNRANQNLGAQLITWAENAGARDAGARNHTAITATWEGIKYVVDTSLGQLGGPDLFVGPVASWRAYVPYLVNAPDCRVSAVRFDEQETPFTASTMQQIRLHHESQYPPASPHAVQRGASVADPTKPDQ
jgi:hypothetical protein